MIFDTHSHLHFDDFLDIEKEISTMNEFDVTQSCLIWSDFESTSSAIKLASKYDFFHVAAWIWHPIEAFRSINLDQETKIIDDLISQNKNSIVAIWEAGLDYFHLRPWFESSDKYSQFAVFERNAFLANKYSLPVIIHTRDAWDDIYNLLSDYALKKFVVHCYTWDYEQAKRFLDYSDDAYIWFSWIVTFKNAPWVQDAAKYIPIERLLVETDAPYLAPAPHRWKLNTSWYTKFVLDKIKELRSEDPNFIEKTIFENSLRFYWLS